MKYFDITTINCIEELKKVYFTLAQKLHPDHGGDAEDFKTLNSEYQTLFPKFKDIHKNIKERKADDINYQEFYTAKTPCKECADDFIKIVTALLRLDGLTVELCGRWLWIGGETKKHKETLKALGCRWNADKKLWSWHYKEDSTPYWKGRKAMQMSTIRNYYGSKTFVDDDTTAQIANTLQITGAH